MTVVEHNPEDFDDWDALHGLLVRGFTSEQGRVDPPPSLNEMTADDLQQKAHSEDMFLIRDPLRAVLFGRVIEPGVYYLGKWITDPEVQNTGLARLLLQAAQQRAVAIGCFRLRLGTRIELVENHRIFRALGFHLARSVRHPGYSRATALEFELAIQPHPRQIS